MFAQSNPQTHKWGEILWFIQFIRVKVFTHLDRSKKKKKMAKESETKRLFMGSEALLYGIALKTYKSVS